MSRDPVADATRLDGVREAIAWGIANDVDVIVHVAGPVLEEGSHLGQLCARCGVALLSYDLDRLAYPDSTPPEDRRPATYGEGERVAHPVKRGEPADTTGYWSTIDHDPREPIAWVKDELGVIVCDPSERWCSE